MQLIFATNNQHKVQEISAALTDGLQIITLKDAGIDIDIPEPHDTLIANAIEKATVIHQLTQQNCFSEDTGLEVAALHGAPGVRSARYAGDKADHKKNIALLLKNMEGIAERSAQFKTVICLVLNNEQYFFTGICEGRIIDTEIGTQGFGYDAVFVPNGSNKTFAQMDIAEKGQYSHRKKALQQLIDFLNQYHG
ncbi:RdgB/HAM1 family non-canonical purine NTP pyrophosphatase [Ferruginibacter yonginensis]|uniref:dITP/XTP pyrophosphatase n=1 Tax=Ferruginibacter yonginensis TaxID=1310416 RepID=A0ABV8QTG3_9BACT